MIPLKNKRCLIPLIQILNNRFLRPVKIKEITENNLVKFIKIDGYYNPEEKVNLEWTTKGESKVVHFDLIRIDQNGKTEELMVQVPAVGNSFQEETYQYRDEFDVDLFVKYIIKANFEDETFALSDTFQIEPEELISNLYPNPFNDKLKVFVEGEGEAIITITSATVSMLERYTWNLNESATTEIDLSRLSPGLYFYSVVNKGKIKGGTIVKAP